MAKKPKNAPEAEGEAGEAPKSKKKLVMMVAAALLLLGAGGGYFFMKSRGGGGDGHGSAQAAESGHGGGHGAAPGESAKKVAVFLDVRDMIVNLTPEPGQTKSPYLKLKVALELKDGKVEQEVKPLMPRVEDAFQTYMRELRPSDLAGSAGLYRLREELLRRVNVAIHPAKAEGVLFKDVVVQ